MTFKNGSHSDFVWHSKMLFGWIEIEVICGTYKKIITFCTGTGDVLSKQIIVALLVTCQKQDPPISLKDLAYYLDKLFDTNEIGTFKVRDLSNGGFVNKHQVAIDFSSGYDAMCAQSLLDGKTYNVNGVMNVLRARVTHDPKYMSKRPLPLAFEEQVNECASGSNGFQDTKLKKKKKTKRNQKNEKIDAKLKLLNIKKRAILTEEELLLIEREKLQRELEALSDSEDSHSNKRGHSESSDSDQPRKKLKKRRKNVSPLKDSRDRYSPELEGHDSYDLRSRINSRKPRKIRRRSSSNERDSHFRDRRLSPSLKRTSSYGRYNETRIVVSRAESSRYSLKRGSSRERDQRDHYRRSRDSRSRSKERYSYSSAGSSYREKQRSSDIDDIASKRSIEYRPNISDGYSKKRTYSRTSYSSEKDEPRKQIIIDNKNLKPIEDKKIELEIKMEEFRTASDMKSKQDKAIKDIMLELGKDFSELSSKHNISDMEKSKIVKKLFETIDRRIKSLRFTPDMTVSNLIMHYRCKYSKIEDKDLFIELFDNLIKARNESPVSQPEPHTSNSDEIWNDLDAVLQGFNISSLTEDEKPKIEPETEREITNITINLNPVSTNKQLYNVRDGDNWVNITVDRNRPKKFYITIKILLKNLSSIMKKYESYVTYELFEYVIRWILEKRITKMLEGKSYLTARELYDLYRETYCIEGDENFVLQTLYEIWEGKYNDPVLFRAVTDKLPKVYSNRVKKQKDDPKTGKHKTENMVTVKTENASEETQEPVVKTEKEIKQEDNTDKRPPFSKDCDHDKVSCKSEELVNEPPNSDDIVVIEPKPEIIDLSDTEMPNTETDKLEKVKKEKTDEIVDLCDDMMDTIPVIKKEKIPTIKTEENTCKIINEIVDLSTDEDIIDITGPKKGSLPHQTTLTCIGSNTTQNVDYDVTVDKSPVSQISRNRKLKKEIKIESKKSENIIVIDDEFTEINDTANKEFNPLHNSIKSENTLQIGEKDRKGKTNFVSNIDNGSSNTLILDEQNEQSKDSTSITKNQKLDTPNKTDTVDIDDGASVDTLILGDEDQQDPCKASSLNLMTGTNEIVTENVNKNLGDSEKEIELVQDISAIRNCDFNDDSNSETIDTIKRYLDSMTEAGT